MNAYGYAQQNINNLNLIINNSSNFYNYKGLNFLYKSKKQNQYLVVMFHGHIGKKLFDEFKNKKIEERVVFRGYNHEEINIDTICISDFLLNKYEDYIINWTLSTKKYDTENIYLELFNHIISKKQYKNVLFFGTSAGGYSSIKFACKLNKIALVSNSQLYLENYEPFHTSLKDMIEKNNDKLYYENQEIEKLIINHKPKKIIIYNNRSDYTYNDTIKFKNFIEKNKLECFLDFRNFEYKGLIPEGKNHHTIQFPETESPINIIKKELKNN